MDIKTEFKYFYGTESESYSFYRFPKLLITDERFKELSSDAKISYGLMLDRISLSVKNGWLDADKRVYIYYSLEDVMADLNCSKNTAIKSLQELDAGTGIGLIERRKQGQGKPALIYVKNFMPERKSSDSQNLGIKTPNICTSGSSKFGNQDSQNVNQNNNKINKTEGSNTESNLIISEDAMGSDVNAYMELIRKNLDYDIMLQRYPTDKELVEGIFELIVETVVSASDEIFIAGNKYPASLVKSKFLKLNSRHLEYVMDCLGENTTKVRNIKKYMLAALFNAPSTISSYYTARVNADFPQYARAR